MKIKILAVGTKMPAWVTTGYNEYAKRLPKDMSLVLHEIPLGYRAKGQANDKAIDQEDKAVCALIEPTDWVVALEINGKSWSTERLAAACDNWRMSGRNVCLLVGGPNGLGSNSQARANQRWSLSDLTLPHPLVRIVLAEQLYRAWTVLTKHPYHK